jgi:hypothetical protein
MVADYSRFRLNCNGPAPKNTGKWEKNAKIAKKQGIFCQKAGRPGRKKSGNLGRNGLEILRVA